MKQKRISYFYITITVGLLLYASFYIYAKIDRLKVETRRYFTINRILLYKEKHGHFPEEISFVLHKGETQKNESWCDFYDKKIPGWGYCYYSLIDNTFYLDIRGDFTALTYNSDRDSIENSYAYDL